MFSTKQNDAVLKRISVSELRLGMYICKLDGSWFQHPFWRDSFMLDKEQDRQKILASQIQDIWVDPSKSTISHEASDCGASARFRDDDPVQLQPLAPDAAQPESVPVAVSLLDEIQQARHICQAAQSQVMDMFEEARMGRAIDVQSTLPLVQQITDSVGRHPQALFSVARLKTKDTYTYLHSVAVCALMLALARQLRLDAEMTRLAGLGGLMHDLGKAGVPPEILNKPGRLTDQEFDVMKRHPIMGTAMLQESGADPEVQEIILHHHEKFDGTGYPGKLSGHTIPLLARMGAVCDVYDAVTSTRSYKPAWNPAIALQRMASWQGHFDRHIFEAFVKTVGIYPIGSLVRLRSQRLAIVAEQVKDQLLTPSVVVFYCLRKNHRIEPETLDLSAPDVDDAILNQEALQHWKFENLDQYWMSALD